MKLLIVIPAFNEESVLKQSVLKIFDFCESNLPDAYQIIIADNKSTDQTAKIGRALAQRLRPVDYLYVGLKGKGAAIRSGFSKYSADIYCFMDADLATDLSALPLLIKGINQGWDVVIGSRFAKESKVRRSLPRKIFSWGYHAIAKIFLNLKIKDLPCGFKGINQKVKENVLPQVRNNEWFFDSELVVLAEKQGYKIKEIPISWSDPRKGRDKSRVRTLPLAINYLKEIIALRKRLRD